MMWHEKYVGRPYIPTEYDCASLAAEVARDVLGFDPGLPSEHPASLKDQAREFALRRFDYAVRVDAPIEAHPIVLTTGPLFHVGAAVIINGEPWFLHNDRGAGFVVCQRIRDLTWIKYRLDGFYKWIGCD